MNNFVFPVTALRSVTLITPDLTAAINFYTKTWQLSLVLASPERAFLAASGDDIYILELVVGKSPALGKIVFRVRSMQDLQNLQSACLDADCSLLNTIGPANSPAQGTAFTIREPQGCVLEFVYGDLRKPSEQVANRPCRLAHVNINSVQIDSLVQFWQNTLGFRLTDRSKVMAFLCCNEDHHAIVLADAPINGLNHVAFLLPDLESVMRGSGHILDHGYKIGWGPGRHGPGDNVFTYFVGPDGIVIEYTAEVLQIDADYRFRGPDEWSWPKGRTDHWGIAPPKSEDCKKAQISIGFS